MNYNSKRHEQVCRMIGNPEVLSQPEKYFGPNYKILLNFWLYWQSLTVIQKDTYFRKHFPADSFERIKSHSREITDVMNITNYGFYYIEREIMAAHIIIDSGECLTFLPFLENL
jgi:hypothetical protein